MDDLRSIDSTRLGGLAGIVFSIGLTVIGVAFYWDQPVYTDSMAEIRAFFTDNATGLAFADWVAALLFVFGFLFFASALRRIAADEDGVWARVSFGGAVATVAIAGGGVFVSSFTLEGFADLPDGVVAAFMRADALIYGVILPWGMALFLTAASVAILKSRAFSAWIAWFGVLVSLALVVGALWPIDGDPEGALGIIAFTGIMAAFVWILVAGIEMLRGRAGADRLSMTEPQRTTV